MKKKIDLQLFAEGASGETSQAAAVEGEQTVVYGKQGSSKENELEETDEPENEEDEDTEPERADFNDLINGEYKADFEKVFQEKVQKIINKRFAETKSLEENNAKLSSLATMAAQKYGVVGNDIDAIVQAMANDTSIYENEAFERGMSVDQLKAIKDVERENLRLKAQVEQHHKQAEAEKMYQGWIEQGEEVKTVYPSFDFKTEVANNDFSDLLMKGIDVKTAYEVIHKDEIISGAMAVTAEKITEKVANNIRANGNRPSENGTGTHKTGVVVKSDPSKWSKEDIYEVMKKVARGEKIEL